MWQRCIQYNSTNMCMIVRLFANAPRPTTCRKALAFSVWRRFSSCVRGKDAARVRYTLIHLIYYQFPLIHLALKRARLVQARRYTRRTELNTHHAINASLTVIRGIIRGIGIIIIIIIIGWVTMRRRWWRQPVKHWTTHEVCTYMLYIYYTLITVRSH